MSDPFSGALIQVDTGIAAGVAAVWPPLHRFQDGNRSSIYQFQIVVDDLLLNAAAAFGLAGLEQSLTYHRFVTTIAFASPAVHPGLFPLVSNHHELTKAFADKVF